MLHEFVHNFIHVELMVLFESLYDEFYSTFEDECSQGGESVTPQKFEFPKMPLASSFYRGRMVILSFLYLPDVVWRIRGHICDQGEKSSGTVPSKNF